jgi:hypothetical protein
LRGTFTDGSPPEQSASAAVYDTLKDEWSLVELPKSNDGQL